MIETSRLLLRPFTLADAVVARHNSATPSVAHFMSDMVLATEEEARQWIQWIEGKRGDTAQVLAVERKEDRQVIGLVGVAPKKELDGESEILFFIADEYQGKGYATEAARAIIWWAFECAGLDLLSAIVKPENKASRRVIEKLGFIYCDTRVLPYDGADCAFEYFRLYHTDTLPGPDWDIAALDTPEAMDAFFNLRAGSYNAHMLGGFGEELYLALARCIPESQEKLQMLDIGCGTGMELDYLWARAPKSHITCLDMSQGMLDQLLENHRSHRGQIETVHASYIDGSYPEAFYDIALSSMTLHHLMPEEKIPVYAKLLQALKPGGYYLESDFIVDPWQAAQYRRRYGQIMASLPEGTPPGAYHVDIPCTIEEQCTVLQEAGFRRVEILDERIRPSGSRAILKASR